MSVNPGNLGDARQFYLPNGLKITHITIVKLNSDILYYRFGQKNLEWYRRNNPI